MIFRVSDLSASAPEPAPSNVARGQVKPMGTRTQAPTQPPPGRGVAPTPNRGAKIPSIAKPAQPRPASSPRSRDENTRQLDVPPLPPSMDDDTSGLLVPATGGKVSARRWDASPTEPGADDDLENIGDRTMITAPSAGGFMMDAGDDDGVDATMISQPPEAPDLLEQSITYVPGQRHDTNLDSDHDEDVDEEGATVTRDFTAGKSRSSKPSRAPAPAALAAKIHAPAVSELRKPRPSKRTPQGGVPVQGQANVLQQMIGKQASEPMPVPVARPEPPPQPPRSKQHRSTRTRRPEVSRARHRSTRPMPRACRSDCRPRRA